MTDMMNDPRIEVVEIDSITANPDNVKTHNRRQVRALARAIERYGELVPIVVNSAGMILAGHGRWLALKLLKRRNVKIFRASLSADDERAFALAENQWAQISGTRDEVKLRKELNALFDRNYDIEIAGFSTADLEFEMASSGDEEPTPPLPEVAVSRVGDVWNVGPHRLMCGSSLEGGNFVILLEGRTIAMVFQDAPYNVPVSGHVRGRGKTGKQFREFAMAAGEMDPEQFTAFLAANFRLCAEHSKDGSIHFQCMDWRHVREMLDAGEAAYSEYKQLCVWDKGVGGQSAFYRSQHELVFVFKSGAAKHTNNFAMGSNGRYRTNVWAYRGANSFGRGRKANLELHATPKSVPMIMDAIRDCSNRGEIVFDGFVGSGSTLIAAHKTQRIGMGIELDPLYVDVALARLTRVTGHPAILSGDGRSFAEIAEERLADTAGED